MAKKTATPKRLRNSAFSRKAKRGLPPGSLVYTGLRREAPVTYSRIAFNPNHYEEKDYGTLDACIQHIHEDPQKIQWVNIDGLHDPEAIERVGRHFDIHPLTLEDIVNTQHRSKMEDYEHYIVVIMRMIRYQGGELLSEQLVLVLKGHILLSFQEKNEGDVFEPVRNRLRDSKGRIRRRSADYLLYALMDAVVDSYFDVLERYGEELEDLEESLIANPEEGMMQALHIRKRQLIELRKAIWPLRELVSGLDRLDAHDISEDTHIYLRDLKDHIILITDTIETYRDLMSGLMDLYLSSVSNRMNEVMKVLAVITTLFVPVTFIAGVYGMNFEYMPELKQPAAYFIVWGIMLTIMISLAIYFKRRRWI